MLPPIPRRARFLRTSRHCLRFGFCALARRPRGHSRPRTRHKSRTPRHKNQFSNIAPKSLFARRRREPATTAAAARPRRAMTHAHHPRHGQERRKAPKTTLENSHFYKTSLKSGFFESTILSKSSKSRVVLGVWAGKRRGTKERRRFPSSCKNCAKKAQRQVIWRFRGSGRGFATSRAVSHIAAAFGAHFARKRSSRAISEGARGFPSSRLVLPPGASFPRFSASLRRSETAPGSMRGRRPAARGVRLRS